MRKDLTTLIKDLILCDADKSKSVIEYEIAETYYFKNHWSSAFTFYLRCSGRDTGTRLKYMSLVKAALCLLNQGDRKHSVKTMLMHAVTLMPNRPEAYFHLSRVAESEQDFMTCYTWSILGLSHNHNTDPHSNNIGYPGKYALLFQRVFSEWWIGKAEQSRLHLQEFKKMELPPFYKRLIQENMSRIGSTSNTFVKYDKSMFPKLKVPFMGSADIDTNYSQTFQDMFVLTMLQGKRNGTFLEIGAADPFYGSNTALLEKFGWSGISIDIQQSEIDKYKTSRKCTAVVADALAIDYTDFLRKYRMPTTIDYLQLDCEPPANTLTILKRIPFHEYRFAVITFEHDHFCDLEGTVRDESRAILSQLGYSLIVSDVAPDDRGSYEDWWVHPELVSPAMSNFVRNIDKNVTPCIDILLNP